MQPKAPKEIAIARIGDKTTPHQRWVVVVVVPNDPNVDAIQPKLPARCMASHVPRLAAKDGVFCCCCCSDRHVAPLQPTNCCLEPATFSALLAWLGVCVPLPHGNNERFSSALAALLYVHKSKTKNIFQLSWQTERAAVGQLFECLMRHSPIW